MHLVAAVVSLPAPCTLYGCAVAMCVRVPACCASFFLWVRAFAARACVREPRACANRVRARIACVRYTVRANVMRRKPLSLQGFSCIVRRASRCAAVVVVCIAAGCHAFTLRVRSWHHRTFVCAHHSFARLASHRGNGKRKDHHKAAMGHHHGHSTARKGRNGLRCFTPGHQE